MLNSVCFLLVWFLLSWNWSVLVVGEGRIGDPPTGIYIYPYLYTEYTEYTTEYMCTVTYKYQ